MQVKFEVRGIEKVEAFLKELPRGGVKVALEAFVQYVLGDSSHGLRHDEPQHYVSRKSAGYTTSPAQMRYFFAVGILENVGGSIKLNHYKRTGQTAAAWKYVARDAWHYKLVNDKEGAYWTRGEPGQTRQHAMAGRRKVSRVVKDNTRGGLRAAIQALTKWMRSKGKK